MTVISSQREIIEEHLESKIEELQNADEVIIPVVFAGQYEEDRLYIMIDGHHRIEAAKELGIKVKFEEVERNAMGYSADWTLEEMLENLYMDSDWYNVETGHNYF